MSEVNGFVCPGCFCDFPGPRVDRVVPNVGKIYVGENQKRFFVFDKYGVGITHPNTRIAYIRNTSPLFNIPENQPCRMEDANTFTTYCNSKTQISEHVEVRCGDYVIVRREAGLHPNKRKVYFFFEVV